MNDDIKSLLREYAGNNGYSHGDYADTMTEAADRIEQLERELADARQDAQRLDWSIKTETQVWEVNGRFSVHQVTEHYPMTGEYKTGREAIDAAIAKDKP